MIENLTFLYPDLFGLVLLGGILLVLVFVWKEWSQSGRKRLLLKIGVALVTIVSLALMVLQPMTERVGVKDAGVLLTKGYDTTVLDSLQQANRRIAVVPYVENTLLKETLDSIASLYILGNGVATYDLWQLEQVPSQYMGGKTPLGIVRLRYDDRLAQGDSLIVQGLYNKPSLGSKLILQDPGGNHLDSLSLDSGEHQEFRLGGSLRATGKLLYTLVESDSSGVILNTNPIPIVVKDTSPFDILILNNFPTFETKYLKNFLAENGHRVLVRSQLTKDRFKFENFNREQGTIYGLTASNLANFDLVIMDGNSFFGLGSVSRKTLDNAIIDDGLGVFIQPDNRVFSNSGNRMGFRFKRKRRASLRLDEFPKIGISAHNYTFENDVLLRSSIHSEDEIVAAFISKGSGRLGTSVLQNTYQLVLDGHQDHYQYIWSKILTDLGKRERSIANWQAKGFLTYPDESFAFSVRTSLDRPEVMSNESDRIPLEGDLDIDDFWMGTVYPKETGWNELRLVQDSTQVFDYYVMDTLDWVSLSSYDRIQENRRFFQKNSIGDDEVVTLQPLDMHWFFVVFVLGIGFLWLEPRM